MIIGIGHPCTGTGYTAKTLQNSGLKVGHERRGKDGMVAWTLAAPSRGRVTVPFTQGLRYAAIPWDSAKIIHVARNPVDSLNSVIAEDTMPARKHRQPLLKNLNRSPCNNAMQSMVQWAEFCRSRNPQIIYRVDVTDDNEKLADYLGTPINPYPKIHNSKSRSKKFRYGREHIWRQDSELVNSFINLCFFLGYEEEADILTAGRDV